MSNLNDYIRFSSRQDGQTGQIYLWTVIPFMSNLLYKVNNVAITKPEISNFLVNCVSNGIFPETRSW